ncbi:MAG: peptide chain release factor N(5)-glutamine methyltransferase [Pseudolabrys sp.]
MTARISGLGADTSGAKACELLADLFGRCGIESPQADARILVAHALGLDRAALLSQGDREIDAREADAIAAHATRRLAREPVARILGTWEFWSLPLRIDPSVLVPRPDTETVVELALDWVVMRGLRMEKLRVLDIGTGCGALLLALLSELEEAIGTGTDISAECIEIARDNAARLGYAAHATFLVSDFGKSLDGPFDLIVSNPPYIRTPDIATLAPEVRDYDPALSLDGGADGLNAYRAIAADARRLLAPGGRLIVELGRGQEDEVSTLFAAAGLTISGPARKDLSGVSRALSASAP